MSDPTNSGPGSGPAIDASSVLAWKLPEYLSNKRPSAQERLRTKRLGDTRDLAQKNEDLISPNDMIPAEAKLLLYVLSS